ncbi:MAG TPA: hypothetical protein VIF81_12575 [Pyrinomonadaceae bacterium]
MDVIRTVGMSALVVDAAVEVAETFLFLAKRLAGTCDGSVWIFTPFDVSKLSNEYGALCASATGAATAIRMIDQENLSSIEETWLMLMVGVW